MIFPHEAFDEEVYPVAQWVAVTKKGPETDIFHCQDISFSRRYSMEVTQQIGYGEGEPLHKDAFDASGRQEDMARILNLGLNVDDKNEALSVKFPIAVELLLHTEKIWVWDGIYHRKKQKFKNKGASMVGLSSETLIGYSPLRMFFLYPLW